MKKKENRFTDLLRIRFFECPVYIWVLLGLYELLLLLNCLLQAPPWEFITSDMGGYIERAQWIAHGIFNEKYLSFYPQGTHYLFAIFLVFFNYFTALHLIAIFQTLCIVAAIYFFFRLIYDLFNSNTIATIAVFGVILLRTSFSFSSFYLSENVYFLFQTISLWMIYRICIKDEKFKSSSLVILGFLTGYTILIRPTIIVGYVLIALYLLIRQKASFFRKNIILFAIFAMVPGLTQSIYTSILLKKPTLYTSGGGYELLFGLSGYRTITSETEYGRWVFTNNNYKFDKSIVDEVTFPYPLWEDEGWMKEVKKLWHNDRKTVIKNILRNCRQVWAPVTVWPLVWRGQSNVADCFIPFKVYAWFAYALGLWGLILAFRRKLYVPIVVLVSPIIGLEAMCIFRCGEPRYLIPFFWLVIAFAAYGFAHIIYRFLKDKVIEDSDQLVKGRSKKMVRKYLLSWLILCMMLPILIWQIHSKTVKTNWYWHGELLEKTKFVSLTKIAPSKVFAPKGIVRNSKLFGGPIRINDFVYQSGFFSNGDSEIEFPVDGKYHFFEAEIGIEQNADLGGEVAFYIWADGIRIFPNPTDEEKGNHIKRYGDLPSHLRIYIGGSKRIMLEVKGLTGNNTWRDRGVWGGPVFRNN